MGPTSTTSGLHPHLEALKEEGVPNAEHRGDGQTLGEPGDKPLRASAKKKNKENSSRQPADSASVVFQGFANSFMVWIWFLGPGSAWTSD